MEAVYGVEGFPKLWFEPKKLKEPSQKFNDINKDKSSCSNALQSLLCRSAWCRAYVKIWEEGGEICSSQVDFDDLEEELLWKSKTNIELFSL